MPSSVAARLKEHVRQTLPSKHWWVTMALVVIITIFYWQFCDSRFSLTQYFFFELRNDLVGVLYLIPFVYATLTLRLSGAIASWLLICAVAAPRLARYSLGLDSSVHNAANLSVPFLIALVVLLEMRWRERHRQLMIERENERRMQIERVFAAQESERQRISQGLHDDVLQRLLSIAYMAESLGTAGPWDPASIQPQSFAIRDESIRLSDELRRLSYDLRPSILDNLGLLPAVNWLCVRMRNESGINTRVVTRGETRRLPDAVETAAFRIAQEALHNVARHSQATETVVSLLFNPDHIVLEVSDNGVGFSPGHATTTRAVLDGHLGLSGMKERVASLQGNLTIRSRPNEGTRVRARLPIKLPPPAEAAGDNPVLRTAA